MLTVMLLVTLVLELLILIVHLVNLVLPLNFLEENVNLIVTNLVPLVLIKMMPTNVKLVEMDGP